MVAGASTALQQLRIAQPALATFESLSIIYKAIAAKSDMYAGSDHLLDDVVAGAGRKSSSARELYPGSVSLAYGELTEECCKRVFHALQLTPSSRLLDIGSAFGRFCVYAALATGASVTGVEAGIKRAKLASQFLDEIVRSHSAIVAPFAPGSSWCRETFYAVYRSCLPIPTSFSLMPAL